MRARAQTRALNRRGVQNHPLLTCKECSIEWILNSYHNNRLPRTKNSSNRQSGRYKSRRVQFAFRLSRTTRTNGKNRNCSRARGLNCTKNRGSPIPLLDGFYLGVIDVHFQRRTNALIYSSKSSSQSCYPQIGRSCSYRDLPPRRRSCKIASNLSNTLDARNSSTDRHNHRLQTCAEAGDNTKIT